jgi:hypothetical protein
MGCRRTPVRPATLPGAMKIGSGNGLPGVEVVTETMASS